MSALPVVKVDEHKRRSRENFLNAYMFFLFWNREETLWQCKSASKTRKHKQCLTSASVWACVFLCGFVCVWVWINMKGLYDGPQSYEAGWTQRRWKELWGDGGRERRAWINMTWLWARYGEDKWGHGERKGRSRCIRWRKTEAQETWWEFKDEKMTKLKFLHVCSDKTPGFFKIKQKLWTEQRKREVL